MNILKKIVFIFSFSFLFLICSCSLFKTDGAIARENLLKLIDTIENKDKEELIKMFSNEAKSTEDIKPEIDNLLNFYQGTHEAIICNNLETNKSRDKNEKITQYYMDYTVTTTKSTYYLNIMWYVEYAPDVDTVGIWLLCIEEYKDGKERSFDESKIKGVITIIDNLN